LTESLAKMLRREIRGGKWRAGEPLPSERSLAESFGVSRVTARRCLQKLSAEGIVAARAGRGYFPIRSAVGPKSLRTRRSILYYYSNDGGAPALDSLHASIINGANAESMELGLSLYAVSRPADEFLRTLEEGWADTLRGVLLDWVTTPVAEALHHRGVPFVVVEDALEAFPVVSVIQDNTGGTTQALEHLAGRGHRRFGIVVNTLNRIHAQQRLAAYRAFLLRNGLPSSPGWVGILPDREASSSVAVASILDERDHPNGVFVSGQGLLPGVLDELARRGLRCPDDVSLVVWGDPHVDSLALAAPAITHVTWDGEEMGRLAIRALEQTVQEGTDGAMVMTVPTRLVDCGSVAAQSGTPPQAWCT
jgi:LacI family transcriptional regulator